MQDLKFVCKEEQIDFFDSFDQVLCDVDGVLWNFPDLIHGAESAIKSLRDLGKNVSFISNRTTKSHEFVFEQLKSKKIIQNKIDLIMPEVAIISHLKKINFDKEIYFVGMAPLRNAITEAGFKIAEYAPDVIEESVPNFLRMSLKISTNVGAVVTDLDVNVNYLKLQRASLYLQKPEVLFITGNSSSQYLNMGRNHKVFNNSHFDNILEEFSGRKALRLAKPSVDFNSFVKEKLELDDASRVLFVGDSVEEDMAFAAACGYQKLLVLSGNTEKDSLENWTFPEECKPKYYVESLEVIQNIFSTIY